MEFLELRVRRDWQERRWYGTLRQLGLWYTMRLLLVMLMLIGLLIYLLPTSQALQDGAQLYLVSVPLCVLTFWGIEYLETGSLWRTGLAFGAYSLAWGVAYLGRPWGEDAFLRLPVWTNFLIPVVSWTASIYLLKSVPHTAERLGIIPEEIVRDLALGGLLGGALGFHYLYTLSSVRSFHVVLLEWDSFFWYLCYLTGLRVLGEELLFRGLIYSSILQSLPQREFWLPVFKITLFNIIIHVMVVQGTGVLFGGWILVYLTFLSLMNFYLRHRRKRLLPCFVANVIFNLCLSVVVI